MASQSELEKIEQDKQRVRQKIEQAEEEIRQAKEEIRQAKEEIRQAKETGKNEEFIMVLYRNLEKLNGNMEQLRIEKNILLNEGIDISFGL